MPDRLRCRYARIWYIWRILTRLIGVDPWGDGSLAEVIEV